MKSEDLELNCLNLETSAMGHDWEEGGCAESAISGMRILEALENGLTSNLPSP